MEENKELRVEEIGESNEVNSNCDWAGEGIRELQEEPNVEIVFRDSIKIEVSEYKDLIRKELQLEILIRAIEQNKYNIDKYASVITGKEIKCDE